MKRNQVFISIIVYIGQILVGYGMGWTAPVIPKLQNPETTPLPEVITEAQASWIGSVLYIGTIIGPYVSGYLSNVRGRKPCLILGGVLVIMAFVILAVAQNLAMIFAGRIFTGLGTGIIAVTNIVYIGEIASTEIRGILLTGTGIFGTLGTLLVYSIGPFVPYYGTSVFALAITVLYLMGLTFIPESPVFHVIKGQNQEAKDVLLSLGRMDELHTFIKTKEKSNETEGIKNQWRDLVTVKSNRKALFITFTLNILQQLSGIVVVIFFATRIFELAGSSILPNIATIIIGVTQLVASSITPIFVERSGRKLLLLVSTGSCFVSLAVLGFYFYLDHIDSPVVQMTQWLPLVTLILFFLSYDMGFGIIPGTFIGEMFQSNVRSTGSTITITSAWLFGFGVSTAFGYMITELGGHFTFWIFSSSCLLAFLFTVYFVPETKGKSLVQIQEMLSK